MMSRPAVLARLLAIALACAFAIAAGGCSGGSSPAAAPSASGTGQPAAALAARQALTMAAGQAKRVTSFTATMDINSTGAYTSHLTGTLAEQTRPVVLAHQKYAVTAAGTTLPGGMETLLTKDGVYVKLGALSRMLGKPWVKMPFSSLNASSGANFGPLIHQMQSTDPLALARLLPAASDVRQVGTQAINGVPTTGYTGMLDVTKALARTGPSLKKLLGPALAAAGVTSDRFTVWVDSQHEIRKFTQLQTGARARISSVMVVTSINQQVHIQVPPASRTAIMPGL